MHVSSVVVYASVLLLLSSVELRRAGRGRGLRGARHKLARDRMRGAGRHSRSDHPKPGNCSESSGSDGVLVDCQDRYLTSIPASHTWSKAPQILLLAHNRIKVLRDGAFAGYQSLTSLDLQQNHISLVEEDAFQGLTGLTSLLLQHNRLTTLSEEAIIAMSNLRFLRLYDNPWHCRCQMDSLIQTLQVPSNRHLANHARCAQPIWLKGKKLKRVDPESLCKEPDSAGRPQGDQTDPAHPGEPSPFQGKADATTSCHTYYFPQVRLDCSNRGLTEVPVGVPEDVVHVDLSHNNIRHLKAKSFQGLKSLKTLNISHNNMERIDTASLSGLLHLHQLDLAGNGLHFIQHGVLEDLYFLSKLKLEDNPWVCDYSIHYMVYWLHLHPGVKHTGLLCRSPLQHTGESVQDYVRSYNRGCPRDKQESQREPLPAEPLHWGSSLEVQGEPEEEVEPQHLRRPQKYQIFRLSY
ncbi:leucine-rich repeat-containing protein 17-like [Entelurus aequoreus]|uniref:leucine-rich repeat-containing protein 17-like n=1 Tax=Entelurus aequoreus TaxID=161455 RepID=UPI002B1E1777|nr:leucine-rich repeat-containing protein 17-like [Entelurus aequoreus]XP_061899113.1 leucine-rich repeat-containing protein 17-like [Entelurus aequoreus]